MAEEKKCKMCGAKFTPNHANTKFCSELCRSTYYQQYRKNWKEKHTGIEKDYTKGGDRAYNNIRQRCTNPNHPSYTNYGGRGITLEITREEFKEIYFGSDTCDLCGKQVDDKNRMNADGRTLDRIDQARPYEKGNLRILCRACNTRLAFNRRKNK